jgi:hypothetical protein
VCQPHPHRTKFPPVSHGIAIFCALTIWALGLFSTSPLLHGVLHSDAGHAGHACAFTLFREGVESDFGATVTVPAPALCRAGEVVAVAAIPVADVDVRLPPACGPPFC